MPGAGIDYTTSKTKSLTPWSLYPSERETRNNISRLSYVYKYCGKNQEEKREHASLSGWYDQGCFLNRLFREGSTEKVISEQRPEEGQYRREVCSKLGVGRPVHKGSVGLVVLQQFNSAVVLRKQP